MYDSLSLSARLILHRWTEQSPQMVADLQASNQLIPALDQANHQMTDLLYNLTIVHKMDYNQALEIAMNEWAAPPSSSTI